MLRSVPRYIVPTGLLIGCLIGLALRFTIPGSSVRHKKNIVVRSQQRGESNRKEYQQGAAAAPKWKSGLLTFVPAYLFGTALQYTPIAQLPAALANFIVTLLLVAALTYIIQPLLTHWFANWLFPPLPPPKPKPVYLSLLKYKRRQQSQLRQHARVYFH